MTDSHSSSESSNSGASVGAWPPGGLERVEACPVCGSAERTLIHDKLTDRVFCCAPGEWDMYRCDRCGSGYLDPRPTQETIHIAYGKYFTHAAPDGPANIETLPILRRFRRALANGYRNWRYGTRYEPASKFGVLAAVVLPGQRGVIDVEMRYLPRTQSGGRLLDVGAANGAFLAKARSAGWEVVGVEPDRTSQAEARRIDLDVRLGGIECFSNKPASFDVITMSHVIEHVHDPRRVLSQAMALLKPGGCLYLDTPNIRSYGHKRFGRYWRGLEPPRHLVLFHWGSLEKLLRDIGFNHIKRLSRTAVYPGLAAASRAISQQRDPVAGRDVVLGDHLIGLMLSAKTVFRRRDTEFIILMAFKR